MLQETQWLSSLEEIFLFHHKSRSVSRSALLDVLWHLQFHSSRIVDFASQHPKKEQKPLMKSEADVSDAKPSPLVHSLGLQQISDSGMSLILGFSGASSGVSTVGVHKAQQSLPNLTHFLVRSHTSKCSSAASFPVQLLLSLITVQTLQPNTGVFSWELLYCIKFQSLQKPRFIIIYLRDLTLS